MHEATAYEIKLKVTDHWRNTIQTTMRYHLTPGRNNRCWWHCREKETLIHCWWKCKLVQPSWETVCWFPRDLGYYPGELPQSSKTGQHSNSRNTENTTLLLLGKSNLKTTIIRFFKVETKGKMLRAATEKGQVTYEGEPIRLTADLSTETLQARREWGPIFNILKEKNFKPRILYPAKLSFISEGEIKSFTVK